MNDAMELLAPAGDEAALHAAVCAGADAVYLGYSSFGARAAAVNFDAEALQKAVEYAHLYHVRVHVTVNTLVKQGELEAVYRALQVIAACRADAVIVQDMGVARLAREAFPALERHASTQMALHTAEGVRFAAEHGFRRVVLARECTLETIAEAAATGLDIEVFVHGALCAGVSGQCLLSSMAGGRSGNRGRCAQPCRQTVTLGGRTAALLSMRDLCLRDHLPELRDAGVKSLKIEGRLKSPEYVAVVTDRYRRALDALARGEFQPADDREKTALRQIYNRGGFTGGHAAGEEDAALCAVDRTGHEGVPVGHIISARNGLASASLTAPLHDGDSLRIESAADVELRYSGHEESTQATLRLRPGERVNTGDAVVRLADAEQLLWAQNLTEPKIPIRMRVTVRAGQPLRLTVNDGINEAEATGEPAQKPLTRALAPEEILRQITKLGDTPFITDAEPEVETNGAFAPVSALNRLRREALGRLVKTRQTAFFESRRGSLHTNPAETFKPGDSLPAWATAAFVPPVADTRDDAFGTPYSRYGTPDALHAQGESLTGGTAKILAVSFSEAPMGKDFLSAGANLLLYTPGDVRFSTLEAELPKLPAGAWLSLPPQLSGTAFRQLWPAVEKRRERIAGVVLGSVGQLGFQIPMPVALGDGVPITNREAARELISRKVAFCTHWPELSRDELNALGLSGFPCLLRVYGRERVMLLNHCPQRAILGLATGRTNCALCQPGDRACARPNAELTDRRGFRFPLLRLRTPEGCVLAVYNALPTDLSGQESRRRAMGAGMLLSFTVESPESQLTITRRFAALMRGDATAGSEEPSTSGHFLRGVE